MLNDLSDRFNAGILTRTDGGRLHHFATLHWRGVALFLLVCYVPAMQSTFETAFAAVQALAKDFEENRRHYLSPGYQESEVRKDFIDKFLIALGWDVHHDWQKNPFEQEVKVERGVTMQEAQKRADYAFFVGPNFRDVRFFVEAKKPFGDIATAQNYFQTIRYGWNAQTPVAVLTDFEQFQILDCRYKPDVDTALSHCIQKFHFSEYADHDKFAVIYHLFSRDAVAAGSLDKFAAELPKKRGKAVQRGLFKGGWQSIDEAFLEELDGYRDVLARSFKNKNPALDGDALTEITQRTIDRLVFIRFLEDKMIHPENLISEFGNKGTAWKDFIAASRKLDGIYNGIVFKQHAILDAPGFKVDDGEFAGICEKLAHVNSPYDFNSIPIHILGSIYERFLGKVIVTTAKRATLEEKPEVRKAGGVYYTPEYIVRYIVENTVGKQIEGKTPAQIAEMRFADIACGSGSFLLGVFDLLLSYHGKWFNANPDKAKKAGCVLGEDGAWHLSLKQRREILVNNIYGVDIDNQAVEVAQLSLYLKLLEDETTASARQHQLEFHETILPSLNKNIVCGNSLIGTDILTGQLFASEEERKLNPMDYEQRFPEIMKRGGFDAIVGNPPYVRIQRIDECQARYLFLKYKTPASKTDLSQLFLERALALANKTGLVGYICTSQWMSTDYGRKMRAELSDGRLHKIFDFGSLPVFANADTYPAIFILSPTPAKSIRYQKATNITQLNRESLDLIPVSDIKLSQLSDAPWTLGGLSVVSILEQSKLPWKPLRALGQAFIGTLTGMDAAFVIDQETAREQKLEDELLLPYAYRGAEVQSYLKTRPSARVIYPYRETAEGSPELISEKELRKSYPKIHGYLSGFKDELRKRMDSRKLYADGPDWYRHLRAGSFRYIRPAKLLVKGIDTKITVGLLDEDTSFNGANCPAIILGDKTHSKNYFLGILNSRLMSFYLRQVCPPKLGGYTRFNANNLNELPVRVLDDANVGDKTRYERIVELVEQMLATKPQLAAAQSDKDKDFYGHKCESLDRQIDALVYELYGLTDKEVKIVEGLE